MKSFQGPKFGIIVFLLQLLFLFIFGFFIRYSSNIDPSRISGTIVESRYFYFQDVQGMMFLGFGFLMVFLKNYGYSSIGLNFLLCVFTIQWSLIMNGCKKLSSTYKIEINVDDLLNAEFSVAAILISFGAVLGKLSPLQYILMTLMEVPILTWNEYLGREVYHAVDMGDTIFVHTFGAYFGLACSWIISRDKAREHENEGARYNSDLFSILGTLILWIFWPSFNAGGADGDGQQRAIINTVVSLCGSTLMVFVINSFVTCDEDKDGKMIRGKFNMVYIQNATLAGGVGVGACSNLMIQPWGALLIGCVVGTVSILGFRWLTPLLTKIYLHDTCGVHNLHGMPGIIGGIGSSVAAAVATQELYGPNIQNYFPAMPKRTASQQAGYQLGALGSTLAIAIVGGLVVGLILRFIRICDEPKVNDLFSDERFWQVPPRRHISENPENGNSISENGLTMIKF